MGEKRVGGQTVTTKRVHILVEGDTEEKFVKEILAPHLWLFDILVTVTLASTKQVKERSQIERGKPGRIFKGGVTRYSKLKFDIMQLMADRDAAAITTMIDFYGLPDDFPKPERLSPLSNCYEWVAVYEQALVGDIGAERYRFIPFLTLHEFEAWLFSDLTAVASAFPGQSVSELETIVSQFDSPEEINEGRTTHPSARLKTHLRRYDKAYHGPLIANRIGLDTIRKQCPHFDQWLSRLESLAQA